MYYSIDPFASDLNTQTTASIPDFNVKNIYACRYNLPV